MTYPVPAYDDAGGPSGYTYAGLVVQGAAEIEAARTDAALRRIRFSGWIAPPDNGWIVVVAGQGDATIAAGRRGVLEVGGWLSAELQTTVFAFRVLADRQLAIAAWAGGTEVGRYLSDPSYASAGDSLDDEPVGVEYASAFAEAAGRPTASAELADLLGDRLDPDSVVESERLADSLRLLGFPQWLVSVSSLPRDIPAGPSARSLTRLGAGVGGLAGRPVAGAVGILRRWRPPRA
ncbi:hypothetical protein M6D93_03250 [Jatrophihabitans telluris]|uniref:Uncharacterized protein n=1 Tax=Jatrophihabitans telluris TaxID=2038343 RepID=A0ABY4QZX2_9ACTN|nr:hypothetical protein [Jatrophihabitans telluris]UQX89024.1 hypothetical protein M6D93_03250 [Jatrophihabitans telluris]